MTLDQRFDDLRKAVNEEITRAKREAVAEVLRAASTGTEQAAALEFLKTLPPPPGPQDEKNLRAQRFARVRVAEIQLYHAAAMKMGRLAGDVYTALKPQVDAARESYREKFLTPVNGTADYLHVEFVRTLANDDAALLGPEYPGPLV